MKLASMVAKKLAARSASRAAAAGGASASRGAAASPQNRSQVIGKLASAMAKRLSGGKATPEMVRALAQQFESIAGAGGELPTSEESTKKKGSK